jgi:hypothetical protein
LAIGPAFVTSAAHCLSRSAGARIRQIERRIRNHYILEHVNRAERRRIAARHALWPKIAALLAIIYVSFAHAISVALS